jgi:hypothetical protein
MKIVKTVAHGAMERETIRKNRVTSRKTTGVGVNFFRKGELL